MFNLSCVYFLYTIFTQLNKSRCCKLFRYEDPPHTMLKLVIRNVHVIDLLCNICNTYMFTNTNQALAQNFEPFSAHVKARPWCSSGWSEEWAVIWKWGLPASCTRLPMSDLMLWRLAAFVQYPGQCSICTISWPILWLYNILPNTLLYNIQYVA